jgi:hypothetical protein
MGLALVVLSLGGYVLLLGRLTRAPIAALPAVVTSGTILVLYAGALAGVLQPTARIVLAGGIAALVTALVPLRSGLALARRAAADPGVAALLFCGLLFWIRMRGAAYHNWDEFSHWGAVTKEILRLDGLPEASSPLRFLSYPPGAALFHYFVARFAGYSEGVTIFAHAILTLSMLVVLLQSLDWSRATAIVATTLGGLLLVFVLGNGLKNVLIDHLVAVYFGGAIAMVLLAPDHPIAAAGRALPVLMALPLLKEVGLFLALLAAAIIALMLVREKRAARSPRRAVVWAIAGVVLFLGPYLAAKTWSIHVRDAGFALAFDPKFPALDLARTLAGENRSARDDKIVSSFYGAWWRHTVQKSGWSALVWIAVLAAAFVIAYWRAPGPEVRARILICSAVLPIGCALYGLGLLTLYLHNFSDYDATHSRQFGRYLSIYLLGWAWVAVAFLRSGSRPLASPRARAIAYAAGAAALVGLIAIVPIPSLEESRPVERPEIRERALEASKRIPPDKSVFIVWQHSNGFQYWVLRLELSPRRVNPDCWSLGTPADADDAWTCNLKPPEIARLLSSYDYVLVAKGNGASAEAIAPFLGGKMDERSWELFAVEKKEGGTVRLRPL